MRVDVQGLGQARSSNRFVVLFILCMSRVLWDLQYSFLSGFRSAGWQWNLAAVWAPSRGITTMWRRGNVESLTTPAARETGITSTTSWPAPPTVILNSLSPSDIKLSTEFYDMFYKYFQILLNDCTSLLTTFNGQKSNDCENFTSAISILADYNVSFLESLSDFSLKSMNCFEQGLTNPNSSVLPGKYM